MARNIGYPVKDRSVAVGKLYPARTRTLATNQAIDVAGATTHGNPKDGKPPKKGVLTTGGGHG